MAVISAQNNVENAKRRASPGYQAWRERGHRVERTKHYGERFRQGQITAEDIPPHFRDDVQVWLLEHRKGAL